MHPRGFVNNQPLEFPMNLVTDIKTFAETIGVDAETLLDTEYHAFLSAATPLYQDLKTFAKLPGKQTFRRCLMT